MTEPQKNVRRATSKHNSSNSESNKLFLCVSDHFYSNKGIYTFDTVFGPEDTNLNVFQKAVMPHLENLKKGYNTSIMLYGVTGSGKTHTVFGNLGNNKSHERGVIYYATQELFADSELELYISYIEIYNESVTDLLSNDDANLMILEGENGEVHVAGLSQTKVECFKDLVQYIRFGNRRRKMAKTNQNSFSSRSHAIIQLYLRKPLEESPSKNTSSNSIEE